VRKAMNAGGLQRPVQREGKCVRAFVFI